ncbi:hypothetical protein BXZ70DRAFT_885550 [Cristinia sonorae]|uniref:Zn(2)-C6 fungal-type domain-containing protein n=1 Tax=Cristinia sonorae TaxID=1940300 RepID=A0A8K0UXK9_9AGAR|nr:hypothetical protein BXZ70DRAFT_885550 [Cristinia sonorae]
MSQRRSLSRSTSPFNIPRGQAKVCPVHRVHIHHRRRPLVQSTGKKREQFAACGACRMRRVRCDLKDSPLTPSGQPSSCSNCRERGLNCVDEYAQNKAVKQLRKGRRIQQVEAVYGKTNPEEITLHHAPSPPAVIPKLQRDFFDSSFFRKLHIQRPVLDPQEFRSRYIAHLDGNPDCLPVAGQLLAMTLVVWAASFGVDEFGREFQDEDFQRRPEPIDEMLREMLYLIDLHGILRRPSWDGVRLLLLFLPLTQEILSPVMHESTLSQIHALCTVAPVSGYGTQDEYLEALLRGRVFWYGHVLDGVTNGLRGGRLFFDDEDLAFFESNLPSRSNGTKMFDTYNSTRRLLEIPLQIASVCRQINTYLTGPKARRLEVVNAAAISTAWNTLDRCWRELDDLRQWSMDIVEAEEMNRFIHGWQIYIFECYNIIREKLKERVTTQQGVESGPFELLRLYGDAKSRCDRAVRNVLVIIQQNLTTDFFRYDACLVRDGCFFAAFVLANDPGSLEADVDVCLKALSEMRWHFSKSDARMHTLKMMWESRLRNESPNPPDYLGSLVSNQYSDIRRQQHPPRTLSVPPLALATALDTSVISHSAPTTAYSEDGRWPMTGESSRSISGHGTLPPHLGSPLVPHHSPRYRHVSQPLAQPGTSAVASASLVGSLNASVGPSTMPSTPSLAFARQQDSTYYLHPAASYNEYSGYDDYDSTGDHAHSSSDSNHTPTPPAALRYQLPQQQQAYFSDSVNAYSHPSVVTGESPGGTLHHSPGPDEGTSYY